VACGSLPPGVPHTFYARLGSLLAGRFVLDTSGAALAAALGCGPALVKPNRGNWPGQWASRSTRWPTRSGRRRRSGRPGPGRCWPASARTARCWWTGRGCATASRRWTGGVAPSALATRCSLGFLAAGVTGRDALVEALSWGAAAVRFPGSRMPGPADVDRSKVLIHEELDLARPLSARMEWRRSMTTTLAELKHLPGNSFRARVQRVGGNLAGMIMRISARSSPGG